MGPASIRMPRPFLGGTVIESAKDLSAKRVIGVLSFILVKFQHELKEEDTMDVFSRIRHILNGDLDKMIEDNYSELVDCVETLLGVKFIDNTMEKYQ